MRKLRVESWQSMPLVMACVCAWIMAGSVRGGDGPENPTSNFGQNIEVGSVPQSCTGEDGEASNASRHRAIESSNAFGLQLYQKIASSMQGNLAFSPINIETVLAMTYAGAGNGTETERQMAHVLHLDPADKQLHSGFKALLDSFETEGGKSGLKLANRVWVQKGLPLQPAFTELMNSTYRAGFSQLDFAAADSRQVINTWISQQTEQKIKDLIPAGQLDKTTRLVLTGAIYFKEPWKSPFNEKKTKNKEPFYRSDRDDSPAKVDLMYQQINGVRYTEVSGLQILEIPYESGRSMLLLLPKERGGLAAVEGQLSPEKLKEWASRLNPGIVKVFLPRFRVTKHLGLADVLKEMGMQQAFTDGADFSRMTSDPVKISEVTHQAFVDVSEKGTEAAAATSTNAVASAIQNHPVFRADHPFLFFIRESSEKSAAILFMGRFMGPE